MEGRERSMAKERRQGEIEVCFHWSWYSLLQRAAASSQTYRRRTEWEVEGLKSSRSLHGLMCCLHVLQRGERRDKRLRQCVLV